MVVCRDSGWRFDGAARCGLLTRLLFHVKHDPSAESANRTDARGALLCTIQSTVGALATRVAVKRPGKSPADCVTVTFGCLDPPRPLADSVGDVAARGGSANSHRGRPRSAVDGHESDATREPKAVHCPARVERLPSCSLGSRCDARAVPGVGSADRGSDSPAGWHTRATRRHWPTTPLAARFRIQSDRIVT